MHVSGLLRAMLAQPLRRQRARRVRSLLEAATRLTAEGDRLSLLQTLERAAALEPRNAAVHSFMGRAHAESGSYDAAKACFKRVLAVEPDHAEAHLDLGTVYRLEGDLSHAEDAYRRALALAPAAPLAHYNLALVLLHRRASLEAAQHLRTAHDGLPAHGEILRLLVGTLVDIAEYAEAFGIAKRAAAAEPSSYEVWLSLGRAHHALHRFDEALSCYGKASQHRPDDAELHTRRAITLQDLGRIPEALASYDAALAAQPDYALARFHRGLSRLLAGDYAGGWPDYESRLVSADLAPRPASFPRWDGAPLEHKSILVYGEQGLGDQIMFASCLPELIRAAGHCTVECSPELTSLFQRSHPDASVYSAEGSVRSVSAGDAPTMDLEVPLGSLPLYCRRAVQDFPQHSGYLKADARRVGQWREKLERLGPDLKVGISWRGGTHQSRSPLRSIVLDDWQPLFEISGVSFVSLQYTAGAAAEVLALRDRGCERVTHWPEAIADYEETAALVCALDLTISVCTAVIHLAGALGRPVWIMAPHAPEWRYGHSGTLMPWYPSARLFRQERAGEWDPVIRRVSTALRERVHPHAAANT